MLSGVCMETIAFLGCSRGLGRAVALECSARSLFGKKILVARKRDKLESLEKEIQESPELRVCDFSKSDDVESLLEELIRLKVERVFYFAAGGPFGPFEKKNWKDHQWALQVSLLTPARILHELMNKHGGLKQFVVVGSLIADAKADPGAASYSSAKHGLKGLVESINGESGSVDLRIFRPGYMDTELLPIQSKPRKEGVSLLNPKEASKAFVDWVLDPNGEKNLDLEAPG